VSPTVDKIVVDTFAAFQYYEFTFTEERQMTLTKDEVLNLLETNNKAVARALVVLYQRQTWAEQSSDSTNEDNGRGFSHAHAFIGSKMAKFYLDRGFLTEKQVAYWRKKTPMGRMKIGMYWKQLVEAAAEKQAMKPQEADAITPESIEHFMKVGAAK
jgi:hypothetical protein